MSEEESVWKQIMAASRPPTGSGGPDQPRGMAISPARRIEEFLPPPPRRRGGFLKKVMLLFALLVLCGVGYLGWVGYTTIIQPKRIGAPTAGAAPDAAGQPATTSVVSTLAGVTLPTSIVVLEPVKLMNAAGKEVTIPANTIIRVSNRSQIGTLTTTINGKAFVGNEDSVAGKVRLQSRMVVK